eukprot:TRINITY_DN4896_c0_g1_i1.p1 TRINITY_DN4896_c0_g1~~TRINITY_DN4896_c0_g1_i1.p1  ORF type:complete len:231 (+),score=42.62 TRINITY_DN4896_c0_g1_i1:38-730(+)
MPDVLVTQCAGCQTFQGQLEKKSKKWKCVTCAARQTLLRVFARGSGAEMRKVVQSLNKKRIEGGMAALNNIYEQHINGDEVTDTNIPDNTEPIPKVEWDRYVSSDEEQPNANMDYKRSFEHEVERLAAGPTTKWKRFKSVKQQTPCHSPSSVPCPDPEVDYVERPQLRNSLPKWKQRCDDTIKPFPFLPPPGTHQAGEVVSPALSLETLSQNLPTSDDAQQGPTVWDQFL